MTADYHLHSSFSGDSRTNPEDAVRAGIERGAVPAVLHRPF